MNNKITATSPADLLGYVPHTLGFQPKESIVLVTMSGVLLGATLRVDAPEPGSDICSFAETLTSYVCRDETADATLFIVYSDETAPSGQRPHAAHIDALREELDTAGMPVRDGWIVTGRRWARYACEPGCEIPDCTRWQDTALIENSIVSAEMIYRGSNPGTTEQAPAPEFSGSTSTADTIDILTGHYEVTDASDFTAEPMAAARRALETAINGGGEPDEEEALELCAAFQIPAVRDRLLADIIDRSNDDIEFQKVLLGRTETAPDWARVDTAERLLVHLLRFTPGLYRAPLLTGLGWINWYKGKGTPASLYTDKALEAAPGYRLAELLRRFYNTGILPLPALSKDTSYKR
ncbi:DUF4192 domain-containing protein [Arthrobacter crystallopoietes]|uniref:DUF4192 domain-containing protein n=1 Tax=Crystallibacter crystallopoietes TaxID=37928 RepID=A0A1H1HVJ0_9MICC|nr:DUF4192 domain-containing protein [Arthrobacter crystallopoietes]AUI53785.1 hypothetical protein AC20117_22855 [Arthrobacter crystallopoietes]SDR29433.1 protein of unknown function [Arthrobacter crystallopoietes]